ncbi:hypothetical protein Plhal304r1_c019g0069101 [Plasmopara halstedii]
MASNPSSRLNGIFQDTSSSGGGNDALRYTAPREPSTKQTQVVQSTSSTPTSTSTPSSVVYSTMVSLYQYDANTRQYIPQGGSTVGTKAAVGCVIVGADTTYNLLLYNAAKHHLCALRLTFGSFKPTLQAKNYVNFYDDQNVNWSVKFSSETQVVEFMRQVFLTKIHVEIWSGSKTSFHTLISDDLNYVNPESFSVNLGDTVAIAFSAWRIVGNSLSLPSDVITKYAPFEKTREGELRKFCLGDSSERLKALEEGIVGMKKGTKRMVLAPPSKTNGQDWYLFEIELVKTKRGTTTSRKVEEKEVKNDKKIRRRTSSQIERHEEHFETLPRTRDVVPYADKEMELKELRLLQREQELEAQTRAFERERLHGLSSFGAMNLNATNSLGTSSSFLLSTNRTTEMMLSELNTKLDYLIRMAPGISSNGAGSSDVMAVIRGVERLANENDRLLTQINAQHQHQTSYEKRCEDLLDQTQRLQQEKRTLQERYESIMKTQVNVTSELSALANARDAAVTQTNRLHQEYQQLLTAYYQLQQHGTGIETEEQKQAMTFEREARIRVEKQLENEIQARLLAEQEVSLTKKQHDVALQVKTSELSNVIAQFEHQVRSLENQVNDERVQVQMARNEQTKLQEMLIELQHEKDQISEELNVSLHRLDEFETKARNSESNDEIRHLEHEMTVLQERIKELEQEQTTSDKVQEIDVSERLELVGMFKDSITEMFYRFQDCFEEETAVDGKQVLSIIRKVLKSSTKRIVEQLQEEKENEVENDTKSFDEEEEKAHLSVATETNVDGTERLDT